MAQGAKRKSALVPGEIRTPPGAAAERRRQRALHLPLRARGHDAAAWIWDERRQRAAVKVWTIATGGDVSAALVPWLEKQAAPDTMIVAETAIPAAYDALALTLRYADGYEPAMVRAEVEAALFDPATGLLAPKRQRIGGALFRSVVVERVHRVAGVAFVETLLLDGTPMPPAVAAGPGGWFDLAARSAVS